MADNVFTDPWGNHDFTLMHVSEDGGFLIIHGRNSVVLFGS